MKITIETPAEGQEDEIIVRCQALDDDLMNLIYNLKMGHNKMTAYKNNSIVMLGLQDVFYIESVDNKVFAYCENEVYEIHKKLYELEQEYANTDFLRISKSAIVNVSKIARLTPSLNGRFEIRLHNGEKIITSRQYVVNLKQKLGL